MVERELKFQVPEAVLPSLQRELNRRQAQATRLVAHYHDTPDHLLARHGLSLRLRQEGRRWFQTLKSPGADAISRFEHNVPLRVKAGTQPSIDMARHQGTPAGDVLEQLLSQAQHPPLQVHYTTDVLRRHCLLEPPGGAVECALDLGAVRAKGASLMLCELELEHKSGSPQAMFALARLWARHGGLWLNTLSKSARGAMLAEGRRHGDPVKAGVLSLDRQMHGGELLRATLASTLRQVLANASEVAGGSDDADHIHQLRVGLRRLRTVLREMDVLAQGLKPEWEHALRATFARLGELRDRDAIAEVVRPMLQHANAPVTTWQMASEPMPASLAVQDPDFQATLLDLLAFSADENSKPVHLSAHAALRHIGRRLSKLHRQIVRDGKRFGDLPTPEQHRVRKRLKRLRYLAEFAAPLWRGKDVKRYLEDLRPAQDALGTHNDVAVALQNFQSEARHNPKALFAAGYLHAHLQTTSRDAHDALKQVAKAPRFWKS